MELKNLEQAMEQGWKVLISEQVQPDTVLTFQEPHRTAVFHPLNYSYFAWSDPFVAHAENMEWIQKNVIDRMVDRALARIDAMVDEMNWSHEPRIITFMPNVEVTENEDGSYSFFAQPYPAEERAYETGSTLIFDGSQDGRKARMDIIKEEA